MCDNKCVPEAREPKREEGKLENYLKAALYVYPRLERIERDWEEHIKNKAFMSYDYRVTTEKLSVYLAEEILRKEKIEKLKYDRRGTGTTDGRRKISARIEIFPKKREAETILSESRLERNRQ